MFWDSLITYPLQYVTQGKALRHTNSSTSTGLCRPDLVFYYPVRDVCVFRGEEKATGEMAVPVTELHEKLAGRYDDAPYVFGYAAVRRQVCLVTISKAAAEPQRCVAEVIEDYNLDLLAGRLRLLLALLHLSTLFRPVVALIRPLTTPDYSTLVRPNGVRIAFADNTVAKLYPPGMNESSMHHRHLEAAT